MNGDPGPRPARPAGPTTRRLRPARLPAGSVPRPGSQRPLAPWLTAAVWLTLFGLGGCYGSVQPERDAGVPDAIDGCPVIGGLRGCDDACDLPCPSGYYCAEAADVCVRTDGFDHPPGPPTCLVYLPAADDPPTNVYCHDASQCVPDLQALADRHVLAGFCVPEAYCHQAEEAGLQGRCYYHDATQYIDGPDWVTTCPGGADPTVPFCGGACGGCPSLPVPPYYVPFDFQISCLGINEERGYGFCAYMTQSPCQRGYERRWAELDATYGSPSVCAVARDPASPDGLSEYGWLTLEATCLAYAAAFPDDFACVRDDWIPLE